MEKAQSGCLVVIVGFLLLWGISLMVPGPKCGEVGYYPKLTAVCRAAMDEATYCSEDERRDIQCAAATFAENRRRDEEAIRDALYTRR